MPELFAIPSGNARVRDRVRTPVRYGLDVGQWIGSVKRGAGMVTGAGDEGNRGDAEGAERKAENAGEN